MPDEKTPDEVSLGSETAKGTTAKLVTLVVGFIGSIVLARALGPAAYGGFYALLAIVEIVDRPVRGWGEAGKKRFSESGAPRNEIFTALIVVLVVFLLLIAAAAVALGDLLRSYAEIEAAVTMFILLVISTTLYVTIRNVVEGRGLTGISYWTNATRNALTVPLQILLILGLGLGAVGMAYGYALGTLLVVPLTLYYARSSFEVPSRQTLRSLWSYAKYSVPSGFLGKVYSRFDILLIGAVIGPVAVSYFELAFRVSMPATYVSAAAASVLMAKVSYSSSKGSSVHNEVTEVLSYSSLLAMPIFFGALAIGDELIIVLYGISYAEAGTFLVVLCAYRLLKSQINPLEKTVYGVDMPKYNLYLSGLVLFINMTLGVFLIFEIGAIGVVFSTVVAEVIRYLALARFLKKNYPEVSLLPRPVIEQFIAAAVMFTIVYGSSQIFIISMLPNVLISLSIGAVSYAAVLLLISEYHRELSKKLMVSSVINDAI